MVDNKKNNVVKIAAPVLIVPDDHGNELPVLMDRHYIEDILSHAKKKKLSILGYRLKRKNIEIVFKNPKHASVFALTWSENE